MSLGRRAIEVDDRAGPVPPEDAPVDVADERFLDVRELAVEPWMAVVPVTRARASA